MSSPPQHCSMESNSQERSSSRGACSLIPSLLPPSPPQKLPTPSSLALTICSAYLSPSPNTHTPSAEIGSISGLNQVATAVTALAPAPGQVRARPGIIAVPLLCCFPRVPTVRIFPHVPLPPHYVIFPHAPPTC